MVKLAFEYDLKLLEIEDGRRVGFDVVFDGTPSLINNRVSGTLLVIAISRFVDASSK